MDLIIYKNFIYNYYPKNIDDIYNLYSKFNYFPDTNLIIINLAKLHIPKLQRSSESYKNNVNLKMYVNKMKKDLQNNNEIEHPGAHDGANKLLYPIDQQFKWFFMNNKQKKEMLDTELHEYFKHKNVENINEKEISTFINIFSLISSTLKILSKK